MSENTEVTEVVETTTDVVPESSVAPTGLHDPSIDEYIAAKLGHKEPLPDAPADVGAPAEPEVVTPEVTNEAATDPEPELTPEPTPVQKQEIADAKAQREEAYRKLLQAMDDDKAWKKRQEQENQKLKEAEILAEKYQRIQKTIEENPDEALAELGTDYIKLTEKKLTDKPKEPWELEIEKANAETAALKAQMQALLDEKKAQEEAWHQQRYQLAKQRFQETASQKYEVVSAFDSVDFAEHVIREEASKGRHLTDDEGLEFVEKTILDKIEKALSIPKVQEFVRQKRPELFSSPTRSEPAKPKPVSAAPKPSYPAVPVGQATAMPAKMTDDELIAYLVKKNQTQR